MPSIHGTAAPVGDDWQSLTTAESSAPPHHRSERHPHRAPAGEAARVLLPGAVAHPRQHRQVPPEVAASLGQQPDGDAPDPLAAAAPVAGPRPLPAAALWRDRRFLTLVAATALGLFAQAGLLAHLFSLIVPALGETLAGIAMAAATAAAVAGRTLLAWVMPVRADRRLIAAASYAIQILGCGALVLSHGAEAWLIWTGVALFGLGIGNLVYLPPLIAQSEFARSDVPRVVALTVAVGQGLYAFAPALFGLVRELAPRAGGAGDAPLVHAMAAAFFLAELFEDRPRSAHW